jgi:hypothetical protein
MGQHFFKLLQSSSSFDWSAVISGVTAMVAITVSIIALRINRTMARRNIRLSIQQAIFKIVSEKAKDCNVLWDNEPMREQNDSFPHYKVVSEIIISKEVIEKSFDLFEKNYKAITKLKDEYYYLLWKQLRTELRQFIKGAPSVANQINNNYFTEQINDLHRIFSKHFEKIL